MEALWGWLTLQDSVSAEGQSLISVAAMACPSFNLQWRDEDTSSSGVIEETGAALLGQRCFMLTCSQLMSPTPPLAQMPATKGKSSAHGVAGGSTSYVSPSGTGALATVPMRPQVGQLRL